MRQIFNPEIGYRLIIPAFALSISNPAIAVCHSQLRIYLDGFAEVGNGLIVFAFEPVGNPPIVVSPIMSRFYLNGLAAVRYGFVIPAAFSISKTSIDIVLSEIRVYLDGLAVVGNGLIVLTISVIKKSPSAVCVGSLIQQRWRRYPAFILARSCPSIAMRQLRWRCSSRGRGPSPIGTRPTGQP